MARLESMLQVQLPAVLMPLCGAVLSYITNTCFQPVLVSLTVEVLWVQMTRAKQG